MQGFSPSAPLKFWARIFFAVRVVLCIVGGLIAALLSTHHVPIASPWHSRKKSKLFSDIAKCSLRSINVRGWESQFIKEKCFFRLYCLRQTNCYSKNKKSTISESEHSSVFLALKQSDVDLDWKEVRYGVCPMQWPRLLVALTWYTVSRWWQNWADSVS